MFRVSNNLVGILNFVTFLLSIPILAGGIWLSRQADTECERWLDRPIIALGVFLMVVSIAGLIGACCRVSWLLWFYLLVMFLLIVLLFVFTIFAFAVTNKGAGEALSGRGYKEYRLGDYSNWLQKRVTNTKNWNKIKSCLQDSKVCTSFADKYLNETAEQFYAEHLSALQVCGLDLFFPFGFWDWISGLVFVFGLRSDFLSLSMIWVIFGIGYFSFCFRFDFLRQFCCLVCVS